MTDLEVLRTVMRMRVRANTTIGQALARVGLGVDEWFRLSVLHDSPGCGIDRETMAAAFGLPGSETIRSIKSLEKLGWVQRSDIGRFSLTDSGRRLLVQANEIAASAAEAWFADSEAERKLLAGQDSLG